MPSQFLRSTILPAALLAVAFALPCFASAATLTVTNLGDSHSPGQLRTLINAAAPGDTIVIPAGTITLTGAAGDNLNVSGDLDISKNLIIQGAGPALTTIDGGRIDRVFQILSPAVVTIAGVTVQNGRSSDDLGGGGILNRGTLALTDVTVAKNGPGGFGGGILNTGTLTLTEATVSGNTAGDGGGIHNIGTMTLTNITISGNSADGGGGGIANATGTATLTNVTISGNTANSQFGFGRSGGGIWNCCAGLFPAATMTLTNVTVSGNTADFGGGISNETTMILTNVTVSGNSARVDGGGIRNIFMLTLDSVTITSNTADSDHNGTGNGGGIFGGAGSVKATILAGNTGTGGQVSDCAGTLTSQGHNLIQSTSGCTITGVTTGNLIGVNPTLGPLQNNGGPTETHALLPGSPAIDAGDNTGCPPTDQRGVTKPQDGNDDGTAICDIGAFELVTPAPFVTRLYEQVLNREPDSAGLQAFVDQINQFGSVVPTVLAFLHSEEFLNRHTTNEQFLTICYHTFLSRDPDPAGFTAFLNALQAGQLTRDNLLDIFLDSPEFAAQASFLPPLSPLAAFVTTLYVRILGRGPDPAGLQGFVAQLQQNFTVLPTVQAFLASPEFVARHTSNTEFVTLLYRVFLNRVPDAAGLATFVALLNQGTTRDQLLAQFAASPEFRAIERALFPLPNMAGTWNITLGLTLSNCGNPTNNQSVTLPGTLQWTQSDATIQTTFFIGFSSGASALVTLTGTIAPNRQFNGTFGGSITGGAAFSGTFSGSVTSNAFALQFAGRFTVGEQCNISGSISGTR
jgi:hypothetical protein